MERRRFLQALALAPFMPALLKGMDWASLSPEAAAASNAGGYSCLVPAGSILPYVGMEAPPGFLMCDGRAIPTLMYRQLYSAIGKAYGGGRGIFRTPDLRARTVAPGPSPSYTDVMSGRAQPRELVLTAKPDIRYVIKS